MKRVFLLLLCGLLLCGCSAQETFETVDDIVAQQVSGQMQQLLIDLPAESALPTLENDGEGTLYLCDGYTLTVQTFAAGDLGKTLRSVTGYEKEQLQLLQTTSASATRYDCVWTAAGESEDQVGRMVLLDDGSFHYVLTAMAGASQMDRLQPVWDGLFRSVELVSSLDEISSGS